MTPSTFVETSKNRAGSWTTKITVSREPVNLTKYRMERPRWFDYVGDVITECFKVTVTFGEECLGCHAPWTDTYFEVVTPYGKGCVIDYEHSSELEAFIPNSGKALIHGCWKKYGSYRGHAVSYMRAHKLNVNSRTKVEHTCPAKIYNIASGGACAERDMLLDNLTVTTINGQKFTGEESAKLYALIHKRFGYDREATVAAISRLMQSGSPDDLRYSDRIIELANYGRTFLESGK
jgi:hypothetical protein